MVFHFSFAGSDSNRCSKYEEISPPNVEDFCYITDNTYTKQEVRVPPPFCMLSTRFVSGSCHWLITKC
jgi:hypothetical protein